MEKVISKLLGLEISKLEDKSIPSVMKHFKVNFAGKCDMRMVSKIAGEFK